MFKLYEQLLPTRLYGKAPESGSHLVWVRCAGTEQVPFSTRLCFKGTFLRDAAWPATVIDEVPPWYSPAKPKACIWVGWRISLLEPASFCRSWRDAGETELTPESSTTRPTTRNELSVGQKQREEERRKDCKVCPPPRWELKQQLPGYEVKQHNIIFDALRGWWQEMDTTMYEIVGSRIKQVLKRMRKAVRERSIYITSKAVTLETIDCIFERF